MGFPDNPWLIAGASVIAGEAGRILLGKMLASVQAYYGPFSGEYVCLTDVPGSKGKVLIEVANCKHVRDKLRGRIEAVAIANVRQVPPVMEQRKGSYRFDGLVTQRTFIIRYEAEQRRVRSVGFLVLSPDDTGTTFEGRWAGSSERDIVGSTCTWVRLKERLTPQKRREEVLALASEILKRRRPPNVDGERQRGADTHSPLQPSILQDSEDDELYPIKGTQSYPVEGE
jgi:hypothetical protein